MSRREVLGALRLLTERGWALGLLAVVVLSIAFVQLGEWQYHRYEAKASRNVWIDANYASPPVPLDAVLPSVATALPERQQWRPVRVGGTYEIAGQLLVRNRPFGREAGFEVLVPLRRNDGSVLLVDRGWVPQGSSGAVPESVPPPPVGQVDLTVRLLPSEPGLDRTPPPGQVMRIDLSRIAAGIDAPVYQAYGELAVESPRPASAPRLLPRPDEDLGPHLSYAWQWWLFAVAGYGLLGYQMLREARRRAGNTEPIRIRLPAAVGRSRRSEPTDEEWEDAADR